MEGLAPPLKCLIAVQAAVRNGESVRVGITQFLASSPPHDEMAAQLRAFLFEWDQGRGGRDVIASIQSGYRRAVLETLAVGLSGQAISAHLETLRGELVGVCELEIRNAIEILPLKMLLPLLLLQFPAFLLLLFGPLLRQLVEELNR